MAYTLVDETDTGKYGCKSNCVFEKMGSPGSRFCFKEGDLEVVCDGDDYEAGGEQTCLVWVQYGRFGRFCVVLNKYVDWYKVVQFGPYEQACMYKENDLV